MIKTKIMDLQKQMNELLELSFNGQISVTTFKERVNKYAETYHSLQLQQVGVMTSCYEDYIGKKFIYKSKITTHNTIFKVIAQFKRFGKIVLVSENNNAYFLHEVRPYN